MVQPEPVYGFLALVVVSLLFLFLFSPATVPLGTNSAADALARATTVSSDTSTSSPHPTHPAAVTTSPLAVRASAQPTTTQSLHVEDASDGDKGDDADGQGDGGGGDGAKVVESPPPPPPSPVPAASDEPEVTPPAQTAVEGKEKGGEEGGEDEHATAVETTSPAAAAVSPSPAMGKTSNYTLVVYAYWERDDVYAENLRYFLRTGVGSAEESQRDQVAYLIIVQGRTLSVDVPPHVRVWKRDNTCYDFGAVGEALRSPDLQLPAFRYYIILNSSVKGPYLPAYWPSNVHWSTIFTSRINDRVKQVGTSIVCLPATDLGGWGPRIEGFTWATDRVGIELGLKHGVFDCFTDKVSVIVKGEYGMSRTILKAGYSLDSLQLKYQGVNWTDSANWRCNSNRHPTRVDAYDGISMHPLETVFHKKSWTDVTIDVLPEYLARYSQWKYDALARQSGKGHPPS